MAGQGKLTERERTVLALVAAGLTNKEIAGQLNAAIRTVEQHLTHIYAKLRVTSRTEAVIYVLTSQPAYNVDDEEINRGNPQ